MENTKVKILEPNTGKHIAVAGDINTILAFKEDTGGTYSFIEAKVFPGGGRFHISKHVNMKGFT
jgi:hypothetical protein